MTPFRVLLVEDEPAVLRYLSSIVGTRCPVYEVAGTAENGEDALHVVDRLRPDLILTDVKMPRLDGIEFLSELRRRGDGTPTLIVSGHEEFEYARRAMSTGVLDYILKPVSARRLKGILEEVLPRVSAFRSNRRNSLLYQALRGSPIDPTASDFGFARVHAAVVRYGGLAARHPLTPDGVEGNAVGSYDAGSNLAETRQAGPLFLFSGRDTREWIYLAGSRSCDRHTFQFTVDQDAREAPHRTELYRTIAIAPRPFDLRDAAAGVRELYHVIDRSIIPGLDQICSDAFVPPDSSQRQFPFRVADATVSRLTYALANRSRAGLESVIQECVRNWREERYPLILVERAAREILLLVERELPAGAAKASGREPTGVLESIIAYAGGFEEIADGLIDLVSTIAGLAEPDERDRGAVPGFFLAIRTYVEHHYRENLTLQKVCTTFRISRSYLGRLFRRYENRSFGEFLTACRVDAARDLLLRDRDMSVKNVAAFCGYDDPYYFSRVFKASTGTSPTEYRESAK